MKICILTLDGFNEIDSLLAYGILNRVQRPDWVVHLASTNSRIKSMNGLVVEAESTIADLSKADAVLVGSGNRTREIVQDSTLMSQLNLDPSRQLIGAQCSGALILGKLGLLTDIPVCTDVFTKPYASAAGLSLLDQPFFSKGNIATAGGCLASTYLACWTIARFCGLEDAVNVMHYIAPVGEKDNYIKMLKNNISPFLS